MRGMACRVRLMMVFAVAGPACAHELSYPPHDREVPPVVRAANPSVSVNSDTGSSANDFHETVDITDFESVENEGNCDAHSGCDEEGKGCPTCDCEKMKQLHAQVAGAYKAVFYNNDFSYFNDPCHCENWPGDCLKQIPLPFGATLDVGGQYRARLMNERNIRGLGLTGQDDDFLLHRTRVFANTRFRDWGRVYVEYIDAESNDEDFPPLPVEVNRSDLLNAFGDLKLVHDGRGELWIRAGRQELLYGSQRMVSPLDWSNTRRKFEGYKLFWKGQKWDVDAFYTRPVFPNAVKFDSPDYDQEFLGFFSTYHGREDQTCDFYYLRYNNHRGTNAFQYDTLGARWKGQRHGLLWEFEGAVQIGENTDGSNHSAGAWTAGLGRSFDRHCWKPTVWAYYDWASGDDTIGNGYHHLFPLAHKYLGFIDLFGRRNLETINVQVTVKPTEKWTLLAWWYAFWLQNGDDVPYNVAMQPAPQLPGLTIVPGGSQYLGQELDLTASYNINARMNILLGYSHFWSGSWFKTNPSALPYRGDADFFYTQYHFNF